jgi:hypothetical protein
VLSHAELPFEIKHKDYYFKNIPQFVQFTEAIQPFLPCFLIVLSNKLQVFSKLNVKIPPYCEFYDKDKIKEIKKMIKSQEKENKIYKYLTNRDIPGWIRITSRDELDLWHLIIQKDNYRKIDKIHK